MGGYSSGRHGSRTGSKRTTREFRALDIRALTRYGLLMPGMKADITWGARGKTVGPIIMDVGLATITLTCELMCEDGEALIMCLPIRIVKTSSTIGPERSWFVCPNNRCRKRVAILYLRGGEFACRTCHQLVHPSTRECEFDRRQWQLERIRKKLGWSPNAADQEGDRPEGMGKRKYWKLYNQYMVATERYLRSMLRAAGRRI